MKTQIGTGLRAAAAVFLLAAGVMAPGAAAATVGAEEVMANPDAFSAGTVTVKGRILKCEMDDTKDGVMIVLNGNLRCRIRRSDIEVKYLEMKLISTPGMSGATVKLTHPALKDVKKVIFNAGEEVELTGMVTKKGSNWVCLDRSKIVTYDWPKISGHYHDSNGNCHDYGDTTLGLSAHVVGGTGVRPAEETKKAAGEEVDAAAVVASVDGFLGKEVRAKGRINRVEADSSAKDFFVIIMDGNLRCSIRRSDVENKYATYNYRGYYTSTRVPWTVVLTPQGRGNAVRLNRLEKSGGRTIKSSVTIFSEGEEIEISGVVRKKGSNWIYLENADIATYDWPKAPAPL